MPNRSPARDEQRAAPDGHVRRPRLSTESKLLLWATTAEVAGKTVTGIEGIHHVVVEWIPNFRNIHHVLSMALAVVLVIAYVVATIGVVRRVRHRAPEVRRRYAAVAVSGLVALLAVNVLAFPQPSDPDEYAAREREEWVVRLSPEQLNIPASPAPAATASAAVDARPQVWTTAQALTGILRADLPLPNAARFRDAFEYIEAARMSRDGGGWGYFEEWTWPVTEIGAWVCVAEVSALDRKGFVLPERRADFVARVERELETLARLQQSDGGWSSIPRHGAGLSRTYPTVMALWCFVEAKGSDQLSHRIAGTYDETVRRAVKWLFEQYNGRLGWVANPSRRHQHESFLGLNAQALYVLARTHALPAFRSLATIYPGYEAAIRRFLASDDFDARPIERNDRMHDSDRYVSGMAHGASAACACPFTIEGSTFLWYPWSLAAAAELAHQPRIADDLRRDAADVARRLIARLPAARSFIQQEPNYVAAEFLIGVGPHAARPARGDGSGARRPEIAATASHRR